MAIQARNKSNIHFAMSGMTDIVFLLLIFFMLVSTLIVPGTLGVELPSSNNQTISNPSVQVSITHEHNYLLDGEDISFSSLEDALREKIAESTEQPVTVRLNADERLYWEDVTQFIELAKRVKFKLILGTKPE